MSVSSKEKKIIQDKREQRGLLKASSFVHKEVKELIKNNDPIRIDLIINAHKILFTEIGSKDASIGGRFRKSNDLELTRIDGTPLKVTSYNNIGSEIAILDEELKVKTKDLKIPSREKEYRKIISLAALLSHRFVSIHPFENGNGRASRLLLNAILCRAGLYWLETNASVSQKKEEKTKYLWAMRQADDGDYSVLEKIIGVGLFETSKKLSKQRMKKQ